MRSRWLGCLMLAALVWGCEARRPQEIAPVGRQAQPIINGQPDARHPAVGAITAGTKGSFCTGTLITPKLVVTAAHCVDAMGRYGGASGCRFRIDSGGNRVHHRISQAIKHPNYQPRSSSISDHDIAVLILSQAVSGTTPIAANRDPIDSSWSGRKVLVMGYGLIQTQPQARSAPQKYAAEIPIFQVASKTFIHYDQQSQKSACHGDSGGPALYQINGEWRVLGVTSTAYKARRNPSGNPPTLCDGGTVVVRPDVHISGFLQQYITQTGGGCQEGASRACYSGPAGTQDVGECKAGSQLCQSGAWGPCLGEQTPAAKETCFDNKDNDCNGQTDEGCAACQDGQTRPCYNGPAGTQDVGACKAGLETCRGGVWSQCEGAVTPSAQERCGDGLDDNCNGAVDEGCCQEGATDPCYTGPAATWSVGACKAGVRTCRGGAWSQCEGQILPENSELCGDGLDNNCNGQLDEGCPATGCQEGATRPCYNGPAGTQGVGACAAGSQRCAAGQWGLCLGAVLPQAQETCNHKDDNCNGQIDEGCNPNNPNQHIPPGTRFRPQGFGCQLGGPTAPTPPSWLALLALLGLARRRASSLPSDKSSP